MYNNVSFTDYNTLLSCILVLFSPLLNVLSYLHILHLKFAKERANSPDAIGSKRGAADIVKL